MRIFCVGRNYAEHAKELNNPVPKQPVIFTKPDTALIKGGGDFYFPKFSNDVHYEVEIVVRIDKQGKNIESQFASKYYSQIGIGIDFTARDLQSKLKDAGKPWDLAKGFDGAAPVSDLISLKGLDINDLTFSLYKNEELVQKGNTKDMLFPVNELIAFLSSYFTLRPGDLIFTGTPEGVGPISIGDTLSAHIENQKHLEVLVK